MRLKCARPLVLAESPGQGSRCPWPLQPNAIDEQVKTGLGRQAPSQSTSASACACCSFPSCGRNAHLARSKGGGEPPPAPCAWAPVSVSCLQVRRPHGGPPFFSQRQPTYYSACKCVYLQPWQRSIQHWRLWRLPLGLQPAPTLD